MKIIDKLKLMEQMKRDNDTCWSRFAEEQKKGKPSEAA